MAARYDASERFKVGARGQGEALGPERFVMKDEEASMTGAPVLVGQLFALRLRFQGVAP